MALPPGGSPFPFPFPFPFPPPFNPGQRRRVLPAGFAGAEGAARTAVLSRVKRADQTVNNSGSGATLVAATDLSFPVRAGDLWAVDILLRYEAHASPDIQFDLSLPSGATFEGWSQGYDGTVTAALREVQAGVALTFAGQGIGSPRTAIIRGMAAIAGTQGDFQVRFAQGSASAQNTTLLAKSFILATRLSVF